MHLHPSPQPTPGIRSRLRRVLPLAILGAMPGAAARAQGLPDTSKRVVSYRIEAALDEVGKRIHGREAITWRNDAGAPTGELRFHLYLNAFRQGSTFLREAGADFRARWRAGDHGSIEITGIWLVDPGPGRTDLMPGLRHVAPDDGNPSDQTVAAVALPSAVAVGAQITVEVSFEARLPWVHRRTGFGPGEFFMVAQWFPKLGVLERAPGGEAVWNCHQFHAVTEFFADFGTYEVTLDVPRHYVVGATGGDPIRTQPDGGRKRLTFRQEDVHDFAWTADPHFRVHRRTFSGSSQDSALIRRHGVLLAREPTTMALSDVEVILLLHPEHDRAELVERHFEATFHALRFFGSRFGRYPYPAITVVDPVTTSDLTTLGGGMEYPTLFTCGSPLFLHSRELSPEGVTVHECGHQWWYALSANNEFEESWLDEGIDTFSESRCQDLAYAGRRPAAVTRFGPLPFMGERPPVAPLGGSASVALVRIPGFPGGPERLGFTGTIVHDVPWLRILRESPYFTYHRAVPTTNLYADRARYLAGPAADSLVRTGWEYLDRESYLVNSYQRPATWLATLERMAGEDRWWTFLRVFHERSRFRRPTTAEFLDLLRSRCGDELADFARDSMESVGRLDYGIESVDVAEDAGKPRRTDVTVRRFGDVVAPVTVRFTFSRREPLEVTWDARSQYAWRRWTFADDSDGDLLEVRVDPLPTGRSELALGPAGVQVLDENLLNNAWRKRVDRRPALVRGIRMLTLLQATFSFFGVSV